MLRFTMHLVSSLFANYLPVFSLISNMNLYKFIEIDSLYFQYILLGICYYLPNAKLFFQEKY